MLSCNYDLKYTFLKLYCIDKSCQYANFSNLYNILQGQIKDVKFSNCNAYKFQAGSVYYRMEN